MGYIHMHVFIKIKDFMKDIRSQTHTCSAVKWGLRIMILIFVISMNF